MLSIAMEFDSFVGLADEGYGEAVEDLNQALKKLNTR